MVQVGSGPGEGRDASFSGTRRGGEDDVVMGHFGDRVEEGSGGGRSHPVGTILSIRRPRAQVTQVPCRPIIQVLKVTETRRPKGLPPALTTHVNKRKAVHQMAHVCPLAFLQFSAPGYRMSSRGRHLGEVLYLDYN